MKSQYEILGNAFMYVKALMYVHVQLFLRSLRWCGSENAHEETVLWWKCINIQVIWETVLTDLNFNGKWARRPF